MMIAWLVLVLLLIAIVVIAVVGSSRRRYYYRVSEKDRRKLTGDASTVSSGASAVSDASSSGSKENFTQLNNVGTTLDCNQMSRGITRSGGTCGLKLPTFCVDGECLSGDDIKKLKNLEDSLKSSLRRTMSENMDSIKGKIRSRNDSLESSIRSNIRNRTDNLESALKSKIKSNTQKIKGKVGDGMDDLQDQLDDMDQDAYTEMPKCAFSVYMTSHSSSSGPLPFRRRQFDLNNDFDLSNHKFVAPHDGVYVFAFGSYTRRCGHHPLEARVNGNRVRMFSVYRVARNDGRRRMGQYVTFHLVMNQGDEMTLNRRGGQFRAGYGGGRSAGRSGCLSGALVQPLDGGITATAYRTSRGSSRSGHWIDWQATEQNMGGGFSLGDGTFTAPKAGIYALTIGGYTRRQGSHHIRIHVNGSRVRRFSVYRMARNDGLRRMVDHSTHHLNLNEGDEVRVRCNSAQLRGRYGSGSTQLGRTYHMSITMLRRRNDPRETVSAFTAWEHSSRSNRGGRLRSTEYNLNGDFDTSNSRYVAPKDGVYMFCYGAYLRRNPNHGHAVALRVNGNRVHNICPYRMAANDGRRRMGISATHFVKLNQGDRVDLNVRGSTHFRSRYGASHIGRNGYLSGCLLYGV